MQAWFTLYTKIEKIKYLITLGPQVQYASSLMVKVWWVPAIDKRGHEEPCMTLPNFDNHTDLQCILKSIILYSRL